MRRLSLPSRTVHHSAESLAALNYPRDPCLQCFTGFGLDPAGPNMSPPGAPIFGGRNAIGRFGQSPRKPLKRASPDIAPMSSTLPEKATQLSARIYGIDWSGGVSAGDKIWIATLDPTSRTVLDVTRPWQGLGPKEAAREVANWINCLEEGWVGIDAPFGLAKQDRDALIGVVEAEPRLWSRRFVKRYVDAKAFLAALAERQLIGRHRRLTDNETRSPFAPTLKQMAYQTHTASRLLCHVDERRVRILPWDRDSVADVTLIETCPAVLLKALGLSNQGYKLKPGSAAQRRLLLAEVRRRLDWKVDDRIARLVEEDKEGDVLDAILCAMATARVAATDDEDRPGVAMALEEGWIYV